MMPIHVPESYNYIGVFLTYTCNYQCPWCINRAGQLKLTTHMTGRDWIDGLSRISSGDIPLTFGGGEPTLHPEFYDIVNSIDKPMDLLTNGNWSVRSFMRKISPLKFRSDAPYAGIRFSYHPGVTPLFKLLNKVSLMQKEGYSVGIWAVNHPAHADDIRLAQVLSDRIGLDFRVKEFLGYYQGKLYGSYLYRYMLEDKPKGKIYLCRPSELLIGPDGNLYRCHQHLYSSSHSYGNILDDLVAIPSHHIGCDTTEGCSPCDLKGPKLDRYQKPGHCAVDILEAEGKAEAMANGSAKAMAEATEGANGIS